MIRASHYAGGLIEVNENHYIINPPYSVELPKGNHEKITLTLYGNRQNTFGALHHADETALDVSHPNAWRTTGDLWSYEYRLTPFGILKAPEIYELLPQNPMVKK